MPARVWSRTLLVAVLACVACVAALGVTSGTSSAGVRSKVFVRGSYAWLATAGGHAHRLGPVGPVREPSPNGQFLATIVPPDQGDEYQSYVAVYAPQRPYRRAFLNTPPALQSPSRPGGPPLDIAGWSPDSRLLAIDTNYDVVVGTVATQLETVIAHYGESSWAPDRPDRLAVANGSDLRVWTPAGLNRRVVTRNALFPVWGPRAIAFTRNSQIWTIRPDGSGERRVSHVGPGSPQRLFMTLMPLLWSSTGRVLIANDIGEPGDYLCLLSLRSGDETPIEVNGDDVGVFGFTRNGQRLIVGLPSRGLVTMNFTGGDIRPVPRGYVIPYQNWSQ